MQKENQKRVWDPARVLVTGFAVAILAGTVLLMLPQSSASGHPAPFLTALFTATSAVCVTGLIVVDTGTYWSPLGQVIIMVLIQFGGLGIMSMSTMGALILGRKITLRERLLLQEERGEFNLTGLVRLLRYVVFTAAAIEIVGALLLFARFRMDFPAGQALYYGVFHSISAFNNAGFDLLTTSMMRYVNDPAINIVIPALFILGGLGFSVIAEIYNHLAGGNRRKSLNYRVVITMTLVLLGAGFLCVFLLEYTNPATLGGLPASGKVMAAFFQGATTRTAGFNTVDIGAMRPATALLIMVLMFIGASPGSTGGGIKVTTIAAIALSVRRILAGRSEVEVFERHLPASLIEKALVVMAVSSIVVLVSATLLAITEEAPFIDILFESISAFGTVGLSRGLTPELSIPGRLVIIVTMFAGRVGPLTLALAIAARRRAPVPVRYPEERVMIG